MEITQNHITRMMEIIEGFYCPEHFPCIRSDFKNLCEVRFVGKGVIECLDEKAITCKQHCDIGYCYLCECPLRLYLAKTFNKQKV